MTAIHHDTSCRYFPILPVRNPKHCRVLDSGMFHQYCLDARRYYVPRLVLKYLLDPVRHIQAPLLVVVPHISCFQVPVVVKSGRTVAPVVPQHHGGGRDANLAPRPSSWSLERSAILSRISGANFPEEVKLNLRDLRLFRCQTSRPDLFR
jgi:hypothetical protein